jgi:hypothetical protein
MRESVAKDLRRVGRLAITALPNMRVQRTRSARFARGSSPLTRGPLGGQDRR